MTDNSDKLGFAAMKRVLYAFNVEQLKDGLKAMGGELDFRIQETGNATTIQTNVPGFDVPGIRPLTITVSDDGAVEATAPIGSSSADSMRTNTQNPGATDRVLGFVNAYAKKSGLIP